ncbi:hypothetical protein AB0I27_11470 [Streptomyces sp. NPDC050597]|uniref:hypothetical protein n=1 Tax=Streptomyces sp. NPDC050597 TaxID=3157212 RepID=UPI00342FCF6D
MNIAWIVALLRPRDLLMGRSTEESEPAVQLAALVLGNSLYVRNFDIEETDDNGIKSVALSMNPTAIRKGLAGLVNEVMEQPIEDMARACALGMMASCAAAEIEDYATCDLILDFLLNRLESEESSGALLLRALLSQQKSLRMWDTGQNPETVSTAALLLVDRIRVETLPVCELGPYADFQTCLSHVVIALRNAIWSLAPMRGMAFNRTNEWAGFPSRDEILKSPRSEQLIKINADRSDAYAKFVQQTYRNRFGSRTRYILGGPEVPDTFAEALALELLGHASVREARKELALLRLVQIDAFEQTEHVRDALRLLRHSGAHKELSLAVERFRMAGPLWALSEDARQIIQQRTGSYPLGRTEARVLRGAAELMTITEANRALTAVREWREESHVGEAWFTSARLASVAEKSSDTAEYLLQQSKAREAAADRLDTDLARALRALNWTDVHPDVVQQWAAWLSGHAAQWSVTVESVAGFLGLNPDDSEPIQNLDAVAIRLNSAVHGNRMPAFVVEQSTELVIPALRALITEAHSNSYSMKFPSAADVAATLIIVADADLWQELAPCLAEPQINRNETERAFERLAHERPPITESAADLFRKAAHNILFGKSRFFDIESGITPYPEALRFLAAYGLIDDSLLFSSIGELAGSSSAQKREQAARTVSTLAKLRNDTWIQAVASQLSYDHDVSVRSHAGMALALLSESNEVSQKMIRDRITRLLGEDGVAIPIRTLSSLKVKSPTDSEIRQKVEQLSSEHPSREVRRVAQEVIDSYS